MPRFKFVGHARGWLLATLLVVNSLPAQSAPKDSPFLPPANAAPAATNVNAPYSLTGMTVVGKNTLVGIMRTSDKRSFWIQVGKTVGDLTAISYDASKDQAVIRANGKLQTLTMKKSAVVSGPPVTSVIPQPVTAAGPAAAVTQPPVDVPTAPMSVQEEKEMEARMLVTDLLEIGQRQRKAYEEAQRQAAARKAGQATPADSSKR